MNPSRRVGELKYNDAKVYRIEQLPTPGRPKLQRFFLNTGQTGKYEISKAASVSLLDHGNSFTLAGLFVPEEQRGTGFSRHLLEVAFQIAETSGMPLERTVIIRKPLLAALLKKYGFEALGETTRVELLPKQEGESVPRVRVQTRKDSLSHRPDWFTQVPGEIDGHSGNPVFGLYTPYRLRNKDDCRAERYRVYTALDGKIQIFRNRIRRNCTKRARRRQSA